MTRKPLGRIVTATGRRLQQIESCWKTDFHVGLNLRERVWDIICKDDETMAIRAEIMTQVGESHVEFADTPRRHQRSRIHV